MLLSLYYERRKKSGASDLTNDAAEVGMEFFFDIGFDESAALLCTENEMHQKVRGGVRHSFFRPFGAR